MSRCSCCDIPLKWREFKMKKEDGTEEDLCSSCLSVVYNIEQYEPKKYTFEDQCDPFYIPEAYSE